MPVVISLLRGINVGGNNLIKMDALRTLYASLKLRDPQTYVQSGNVVFQTTERDIPLVAARIEKKIEQEFGVRPAVIVRTLPEWQDAIAHNPFAGRPGIEPNKLLAIFLASEPTAEVHLHGREVYVYFPNGQGQSKFAGPIDKALKKTGTGRNWNSVTKLLEIAEKMEGR